MEALACGSLAFVAYSNTIWAGFVYDDSRAILQNDDVIGDGPILDLLTNDFWGTRLTHSGSHKSYRPLTTLSFRANFAAGGRNPMPFHTVNVLLHAAVTATLVQLARELGVRRRRTRILVGALFALLPVHSEAVSGIVGRADLLAALFTQVALLAYQRHVKVRGRAVKGGSENLTYLLLTVVFSCLSMLSKETGVTTLGVCAVMELCHYGRGLSLRRSSLLCLVCAAALLLAFRAKVMGFSTPKFAKADNPAAASDSWMTRTLTFLFLPAFNLGLLLCPVKLSFDWSMDAIPLVTRLTDARNLLSLALYAVLAKTTLCHVVFFLQKKKRDGTVERIKTSSSCVVTAVALALMVLPFLPASNLLFYVGFVVAERILYLPSMGFCLLSAVTMERACLRKMGPTLAAICSAALLLPFGLRTIIRNNDWMDEGRLYLSGAKINPPKAYGNLANVLTQEGKLTEAEAALKLALKHRPNMADAHYNLGVLYQQQNLLQQAKEAYERAIFFRPKLALAHLNLGLVLTSLNRRQEALAIYEHLLKIDDDGLKDPKTHANTQRSARTNMGRLLIELDRPVDAIEVLSRARKEPPPAGGGNAQGILNLLGEAYQALNKSDQAEQWYRAAMAEKPDHIPAYLKYGKLLAKNKTRLSEAEDSFTKAKSMAPEDPSVRLHYGLFLIDIGRNREAALEFERAVNLSAEYESVFNAGVAFRLAGQLDKAEQYYRRAAIMRPEDASSHMNLGAMLHLVGKLREAEQHYLVAWNLDRGNEVTKANLQRLHKIMRGKGIEVREHDLL